MFLMVYFICDSFSFDGSLMKSEKWFINACLAFLRFSTGSLPHLSERGSGFESHLWVFL